METSHYIEREALPLKASREWGWGGSTLITAVNHLISPEEQEICVLCEVFHPKILTKFDENNHGLSQTHQQSGPTSLWSLISCSYAQSPGTVPTSQPCLLWTYKPGGGSPHTVGTAELQELFSTIFPFCILSIGPYLYSLRPWTTCVMISIFLLGSSLGLVFSGSLAFWTLLPSPPPVSTSAKHPFHHYLPLPLHFCE